MEYMGIKIDEKKNANPPRDSEVDISAKGSKVKIFIIPTNEELYIARETLKHKDD